MKQYTIASAAQTIRCTLRQFSHAQRIQIVAEAMRAIDENISPDERARISQALDDARGNVSHAARALNWSRRTLQRYMLRLDMRVGRDGAPTKKEQRETCSVPVDE